MAKQIKEILSKADDIQRLRYLLAKDDIDDLQAAALIISQRIKLEIPSLNLKTVLNVIDLDERTENCLTILHIHLNEEHLEIKYNLYSVPDLFNQETVCDAKLVETIIRTITLLGFYKTGENKFLENYIYWQTEIYKIDVIRRKL